MKYIHGLLAFLIFSLLLAESAHAIKLETVKKGKKEYYVYVVGKNENVYDIASKLDIEADEIKKFNQRATVGLREGDKLFFPATEYKDKFGNDSPQSAPQPEAEVGGFQLPVDTVPAPPTISVVVCQPFMLDEDPLSNTAVYATDFYRGFLLGIDSLRNSHRDLQLKITAIDCGDSDYLKKHASELRDADIIIAPENINRLTELGNFGRENGTYVFNPFQTRDSTYTVNPFMLQGNIPANEMYGKAVDAFVEELGGAVPVILDNEKSKRDKTAFIEPLIRKLEKEGIEYKVVNFDGVLTVQQLMTALQDITQDYLFVPTSGSLADFQKFASALSNYKLAIIDEMPDNRAASRLFGFPEYTRFTGEAYDKLKSINTIIYSRFFNDAQSAETKQLNGSFAARYGTSLPEGVPNQALYGFDLAKWLMLTADNNSPLEKAIEETYVNDGAQMQYKFTAVPDGGFVNNRLLLITFSNYSAPRVRIL